MPSEEHGSDYTSDHIITTCGRRIPDCRQVTTSNDVKDVPGSHGGWDVWIVKLDASGAIVWSVRLLMVATGDDDE